MVPVSGPPPPMHSVFQWKTEVASGGRPPQLETARRHPGQTTRTSMVVRKRGARKAKFSGHRASACQALATKECGCRRQCRPRSRLSTWDQHQWLPAACARHNLSLLWSTGRVETAHSASNTAINCFASVRATKCRREHPVAIPLTPPSGFANAVSLAPIRTDATSSGTFACAREEHAPNNNSVVSLSSSRVLKCSYVHPPRPGEEPHGALPRLVRNVGLVQTPTLPATKVENLMVAPHFSHADFLTSCFASRLNSFLSSPVVSHSRLT